MQMGNWGSVMTHAAKADAIPDFAANLKVVGGFLFFGLSCLLNGPFRLRLLFSRLWVIGSVYGYFVEG